MNIEELKVYAKCCRNDFQDLIFHEEEGVGSICVNG